MSDLFDPILGFERFVQHAKVALGRITVSGSACTVSFMSGNPLIDQVNVAVTYNSAGNYTFSIPNFYGPNGNVVGFFTATTAPLVADHSAASYSGTTLSMTVLLTSGGSATDDNFDFLIVAF